MNIFVIIIIFIGVLSISSEYQKKEKKIDKNTILTKKDTPNNSLP